MPMHVLEYQIEVLSADYPNGETRRAVRPLARPPVGKRFSTEVWQGW